MSKYGIRLFFTDGKWEDFDPVLSNEYEIKGKELVIKDTYTYDMDDVDFFSEYELLTEKVDGMYVRVFDDEDAIKYSSDRLRGQE